MEWISSSPQLRSSYSTCEAIAMGPPKAGGGAWVRRSEGREMKRDMDGLDLIENDPRALVEYISYIYAILDTCLPSPTLTPIFDWIGCLKCRSRVEGSHPLDEYLG